MSMISVRRLSRAAPWRGLAGMAFAAMAALSLAPVEARAAASVAWTSPADGSSFAVGSEQMPEGVASGVGTTGVGLDLVLVLDSSGSMGSSNLGQTRQQWQRDAAIALVNSLPTASSSVGIVEFDSGASVVRSLTPLTPASNIADLIAGINSVNASGGTNIPSGMDLATSVLTGADATAGRSKQMVVISDGSTSGDVIAAAQAALAAGVNNIHSVAIPGAVVSTMQSIADNGNGVFSDFTSEADLANIANVFSGTGGNLVGLDKVEVTLQDGTVVQVPIDGLGNFKSQGFNLALGPNVFTATAFATDQTQASASITLFGVADGGDPSVIPLPAAGWMLVSALGGFGLLGRLRRRRG